MRAYGGAAINAPVYVDREFDAEFFRDFLRFDHHPARDGARARVRAQHVKRGMGQSRNGVEGQVAPQLHPDFIP